MPEIRELAVQGARIAEVTGEPGSVKGAGDVHDLIGEIAFNRRMDRMLAGRELLDESFFDLKTGFAGELAQKITTYRLKLAVYGDFSWIESLAVKAFIFESNLGKSVRFFPRRDAALKWLAEA